MTRTLRLGAALAVVVAVGLVAVVVTPLGCGPAKNTQTTTKSQKAAEDPWPKLATALRTDADAQLCRQAVAELNSGLAAFEAAERPRPASTEELTAVTTALGLTDPEKKYFAQTEYTPLDGNHLAECLYLRDAARSLGVAATDPAPRRAAVAFRWVCRQVVLNHWIHTDQQGRTYQPPVPPEYVLRRGSGSGLERAFVFLALCRQLDLDAYLIGRNAADRPWTYQPSSKENTPPKGPFWAVGVRDGSDILLFDPWRGEPLPGKVADKPATLNEVRADPKVVAAWRDDKQTPWEVTDDDLKGSDVYLSAPLSALTPRMATLGGHLKAADIGMTVALNWAEAVKAAEQAAGGAAVKGWNPAGDVFTPVRALGWFLPVNQGGSNDLPEGQSQFTKYLFSLIPRDKLLTAPPGVQYEEAVDQLRRMAIAAYSVAYQTPPTPREKIQRGKHFEATKLLVENWNKFKQADDRQATVVGGATAVGQWVEGANKVYDDLSRARALPDRSARAAEVPLREREVEEFWKKSMPAVELILARMLGRPGAAEATYLLALSFHERAEKADVEATRTTGGTADPKALADEWGKAVQWWDRYSDYQTEQDASYPGRAAHAKKLTERARNRAVAK